MVQSDTVASDPDYSRRFVHERLEASDWRRFYGIITKPKQLLYVPTPLESVVAMLTLGGADPATELVDLGAGDGRVPIIAAREFGASGVGYELRRDLYHRFVANIAHFSVEERVRAMNENFFTAPLYRADLVTCYLCEDLLARVAGTLRSAAAHPERENPLRVVSYAYPIPELAPEATVEVARFGTTLYRYRL